MSDSSDDMEQWSLLAQDWSDRRFRGKCITVARWISLARKQVKALPDNNSVIRRRIEVLESLTPEQVKVVNAAMDLLDQEGGFS